MHGCSNVNIWALCLVVWRASDKLQRSMLGAWAQPRRHYGPLQCSLSVGLLLQLYEACVPPTASYGCEVWGLHRLAPGASRLGRAALATSHLKVLKEIARVPTSVHTNMLLHELGQRPLEHLWWRCTIRFWNTLAVDACRDAVTRDVRNWAWAFMRGLRALGYEYTIRCDSLIPVDVANVMLLLDAPARQEWAGVDMCP